MHLQKIVYVITLVIDFHEKYQMLSVSIFFLLLLLFLVSKLIQISLQRMGVHYEAKIPKR